MIVKLLRVKGRYMIKDEELILLLNTSPQEGIRLLIDVYGGLVYSVVYKKLGGKLRREDIEECVSDIFFDVYQYREKIDLKRGSIKSLLMIITDRKAIKYYQRNVSDYECVSWEENEDIMSEASENTEQMVLKKEEKLKVIEAVKSLGEPDTTIIIQKYYYGMTAKEIGKGLGMTKNAVEKRAKRALEKLRGNCYGILEE